jgi:hypothetical protein
MNDSPIEGPEQRGLSYSDIEEYYSELGRFIHRFAVVEAALQVTLWHYAKTSPPIARAVFSGARVDGAISFIKRIIQVQDPGQDAKQDLEEIFAQINVINGVRNLIVHFGATFGETEATTSNSLLALTPDRIQRAPVSAKILEDMNFDLTTILSRLVGAHTEGKRNRANDFARQTAWHYKPPAQANNRQKNPYTNPKQ